MTPLPGSMAFVLGAVLASTDPVAVTALRRRLARPRGVQALVQAESLFNDATSLVLFRVAVAGAVTAAGVALMRRRITDPVLETVVALVTPYSASVLAEGLGVSGVTSVVVASVLLGSRTAWLTTADTRLQLHSVYQTVVFLLESVIFALIGLELPALISDLQSGESGWPAQAVAIAVTLVAARAAWSSRSGRRQAGSTAVAGLVGRRPCRGLIHHQDIRRSLGLPRRVPPERLSGPGLRKLADHMGG